MKSVIQKLLVGTMAVLFIFTGFTGTIDAEVDFGGKIETSVVTTLDQQGKVTIGFLEHLNLELLLPDTGDTSARFEMDLTYQPQSKEGPEIMANISKLYVKHRFEKLHLTVGRQPISWSFGSLVNPVNFTVNSDLLKMTGSIGGENAVLTYIPVGWASNITLVAAFPEMAIEPKVGVRGRTNIGGFDVTVSYIREPNHKLEVGMVHLSLPETNRLQATFKGDLGPVGVYGAAGYNYIEEVKKGKPVYLIGSDYSFYLSSGSKILVQGEFLHNETGQILTQYLQENMGIILPEGYGSDLLIGSIAYEIDEFAGLSLIFATNPNDRSAVIAPVYKNQIGSKFDLTVTGAVFMGDKNSQFGPKAFSELSIPSTMLQMSVGYPF